MSQRRPVSRCSHFPVNLATPHHVTTGLAKFGPSCSDWPPNGTNPGVFQIRFKYILAHRAKMYWNLIWKIPGFVPFGTNMTHYWTSCNIPGLVHSLMPAQLSFYTFISTSSVRLSNYIELNSIFIYIYKLFTKRVLCRSVFMELKHIWLYPKYFYI